MPATTAPMDASAATDRASWLACLDAIAEDAGYLEALGPRHWAFFHDDSPTLLVTFETVDAIRGGSPGQMPLGWDIARANGWSHLCLIADGATWWRDRRVWGFFDRLVDDAFFEDFDRVCFYGAGAGGYAAAAYSVAAPGATVLALRPRATLDPGVAGWDPRDRTARRLDFTSRYGFAPDMTEGAGKVFVLADPD
ncbi:MAG: phosphoadenosine phosphosulfate reductase, partial [Gemmobacter sp.]